MKLPLNILHLEDDPNDAELVRLTLECEGIACSMTRVETAADYLAALDHGHVDLILADCALPHYEGLTALAMARDRFPDLPFILVSGTLGEEKAIESLKSGATDYVLKRALTRLAPAVRRAMKEVEQRVARKADEAKRVEYDRHVQWLSWRLMQAEENERRRIARELHDETSQTLTLIQLMLDAMVAKPGGPGSEARLHECLALIHSVQEQVHDLALDLRPALLDDLGLEAAVRSYATRQAELARLDFHFNSRPLEHRLDPIVETECFRVAQGALTNVVRHAHAKKVTVQLSQEKDFLHLRVHDDGSGFDVVAARDRALQGFSLGLLSMEERATLAGGGLELTSAPGMGSEVHAWFPMRRPEAAE